MSKKMTPKKAVNRWYYFFDKKTGAVAKVNSAVLIAPMRNIGFSECSYAFYLKKKKLLPQLAEVHTVERVK